MVHQQHMVSVRGERTSFLPWARAKKSLGAEPLNALSKDNSACAREPSLKYKGLEIFSLNIVDDFASCN